MFCTNCENFNENLIGLSVLSLLIFAVKASFLEDYFSKSVIEDASLNTAQLLKKYKYPSEIHYVTTEDDYILGVHRIAKPGAPPVIMMHGLMDSSATWIFTGPESGLGYYLFDNGYDIWMGNARGNRYSRNHTSLNPNNDEAFWTFSWHEIGTYDLPAMIDYVLQHTGYKKVGYYGHSQGTTSFFVMASMRPEYNDKITMMHALAPVAFMKHIRPMLLSVAINLVYSIKDQVREFLPWNNILWRACFLSNITATTCLTAAYKVMGRDEKQLNMARTPTMLGHVPAGCNFKQPVHYVQLVESDRFCQYDYGLKENMKRYGNKSPPDYPLQNITAPVGLYYGQNDYLASVVDVKRLAKILPNVADDCMYPYKKWNHIDMSLGIDARQLAHKKMLANMKNFSYA